MSHPIHMVKRFSKATINTILSLILLILKAHRSHTYYRRNHMGQMLGGSELGKAWISGAPEIWGRSPRKREEGFVEPLSLAPFFCQKSVALKESISSKLHRGPSPFDFDQPHPTKLLSDFAPVTPAEVTQLVHSMSNKSSQLDYIPTSLLKSGADTFSLLISHLANLSFSQATFPTNFKLALISPLLKKPGLSKSDPSNFRPISNLNTIVKILERLALARLFPHVSVSPSFSPFQSAYRKFHSTETALLKLTNDILENIDSGKITILTTLDMSAAFDTLDHATLLHRLEHTFGLSGFVISWIQSYLFSRSSFVKIYSSSLPVTTILTGVPQGSVLGPLLFVLFISPIANVINPGQASNNFVSFHQYADDTQLYIGAYSSSLVSLIASIESCTLRVHDWLLNNALHLNPSKSEAITFFNPRSKPLQNLAESIETISVAGSPIKPWTSSRIWLSILTLDYLSTNRYLKYVKHHISTSVPYAIFDLLSPLRQLKQ